MKKQPLKGYYTSVLKACRTHVNAEKANSISFSPPQVTRRSAANTLVGPPPLTRMAATEMANISPPSSYGNPCLDLFFHVRPPLDKYSAPKYSQKYLKHLLPLAWSNNPLMTLKLICNLVDNHGKDDDEGFYTAAYWLYQNHPKTLASNLTPIASLGSSTHLLEILYRALEGEDVRTRTRTRRTDQKWNFYPLYRETEEGIGGRTSSRRRREKIFDMANKALERYRLFPNYRFLHDGVSDLYAHCFMSDLQNLKKKNESKYVEMTSAAVWFPKIDSSYDRATLLSESVAKKVFPRESEEEEEEEAEYAYRVREQLRNEVLVPLRKAFKCYNPGFKREPCKVQTYLEEVKAGKSKIKADALLPTEIMRFIADENDKNREPSLVAAAELQWKAMVEDIYLKQGKFKNCSAVCDNECMSYIGNQVSVSLGILLSQLSEEPWNGKAITFSENPRLFSIQGHDLKSKYQFMSTVDCEEWHTVVDFQKVFDLILQVAVNGKLTPKQMIKKVFVFASKGQEIRWKSSDYEAIQNKFKEKGYGDVVPQIVYWELIINNSMLEAPRTQPGMTVLSGFINSNNLVKSFLDTDGDIGPDHFMEAAVSGDIGPPCFREEAAEAYQTLVVVD